MRFYIRDSRIALAALLLSVCIDIADGDTVTLYARLSGLPNGVVDCFVPHGDASACGFATLVIDTNTWKMNYSITVRTQYQYHVTQAHMYRTYNNKGEFDSTFCWGEPWNPLGCVRCDYLQGSGYTDPILQTFYNDVTTNPPDPQHMWFLMIHTEGGHFGVDEQGSLIEYDSALHETSECGVVQNPASRFNNRVGRKLDDRVLRLCHNPALPSEHSHPGADPFCDGDESPLPFPDAWGRAWMQSDNQGGFELTPDAMAAGYNLNTYYLFFLYDDQGKTTSNYGNGGPEGALGGFVTSVRLTQCEQDIAPIPCGDDVVNVNDLLAIINAWGPCAQDCPPSCTSDIDQNCTVNVNDLLAVINAWGPCE
jgi:hypothetical protein